MTIFKKVFILLVISGLFLAGQVNVSRASDYSDEIPLRLKTGKVTEAEFPEKIVDVIKSISSEALQVETMGNRMFLLPLKEFDSYLHVITQDNISYCLHLIMDEAEAPSRIKIKRSAEKLAFFCVVER